MPAGSTIPRLIPPIKAGFPELSSPMCRAGLKIRKRVLAKPGCLAYSSQLFFGRRLDGGRQ
jgi:hypothetical protein